MFSFTSIGNENEREMATRFTLRWITYDKNAYSSIVSLQIVMWCFRMCAHHQTVIHSALTLGKWRKNMEIQFENLAKVKCVQWTRFINHRVSNRQSLSYYNSFEIINFNVFIVFLRELRFFFFAFKSMHSLFMADRFVYDGPFWNETDESKTRIINKLSYGPTRDEISKKYVRSLSLFLFLSIRRLNQFSTFCYVDSVKRSDYFWFLESKSKQIKSAKWFRWFVQRCTFSYINFPIW